MDLETLRTICLKLTATTEGIKWEEHLCFMVHEKIFCIIGLDENNVAFKVTEEDFDQLTEREHIAQAGHFAKRKWVNVTEWHALSNKEWQHFISQSYQLVVQQLPKKIQKELGF